MLVVGRRLLGDERLPVDGGGQNLHERLDRLFSTQTAEATPQQRSAVTRWQSADRFYEKVQEALGGTGDPDAMSVAQELSKLAQPLPEDMEVWRGIRSIGKTFGVARVEVGSLSGRQWVGERLMATTTSREVAISEFTDPGPSPAILQVTTRAGSPSVWIPPLGKLEHARQSELLLMQGIRVRILDIDISGHVPLIRMEVT